MMEFKREDKLKEVISGRNNGLIKVVTGLRRSGKSYLLKKLFKTYLISSGFHEERIIVFSFDSDEDVDKLDPFFKDEPTRVISKERKHEVLINSKKFREYVHSKTREEGEYVLILDEIQLLQNFVGTLNGFLEHSNFDIYVTGSNSRFLSSDIATEFRGRGDIIYLQPLSFKEIYEAKGGDPYSLLDEYMRYGGLPLCVEEDSNEKKASYLHEVYRTTYIKDLKERNTIKNILQFEELISLLSLGVGSLVNPRKLMNAFKSKENSPITAQTINKYLEYLEDAYLIKGSKRYDVKGKRYIATPMKYYFTDLGLRNAILDFRQFERTHLMENLIYNELLNRGFSIDTGVVSKFEANSSGTKSKKNLEVDFLLNKGSKRFYIQSAFSIDDQGKREQEERSLNGINDSFQKVIIVYDNIKPYQNEKGYLIMGLLYFLLEDTSVF